MSKANLHVVGKEAVKPVVLGAGNKKAIDAGTYTGFQVDPATVIVIGIDKGGEGTAHFDPGVYEPVKPEFIESIRTFGTKYLGDILLEKQDDGSVVVVAGRTRVRAVRIINAELAERGQAPLLLKATVTPKNTSVMKLEAIAIAENVHRKVESQLVKAKKAQAFIERHGDGPEAMSNLKTAFGLDAARLHDLLRVLAADPVVVRAVEEGAVDVGGSKVAVGLEAAIAIAQLPRDQQPAKLKDLAKTAKQEGKKAVSAKDARRGAKGQLARPQIRTVKALAANGAEKMERETLLVLQWVLGDISTDKLPAALRKIVLKSEEE